MLWGLLTGLAIPLFPRWLQPKINHLWLESIAQDTILTFLYFSIFTSAVFLLLFGVIDKGDRFVNKLYEWLLRKPVYFGITFVGVAFGLLFGIAIAAFFHGDTSAAIVILIGDIYMFIAFILMWLLSVIVKGSVSKPKTVWHVRISGLAMLLLLPCIVYLAM